MSSVSSSGARADRLAAPSAALGLILLLGIAALAVWQSARVELQPETAPASAFSVERARAAVQPVVATPRVPGTPDHDRARQLLVDSLTGMGWQTTVTEGTGLFSPGDDGDTVYASRVANVEAVLPGTDPSGTVVLAAHYDTVAGSPGAADDGIGLATAWEAARALSDTGPHRNTIMVLLTDGEEAGLLGAEYFAHNRSSASSTEPMVVINNEARGNSGIPLTFRIPSPNRGLVDILTGIPGAQYDSSAQAGFDLMPNNTDFTRFMEAGMTGYDTAITGSPAHYHSPTDTLDRLSPTSLQRMGDVSLAMAENLAAADLADLDDGSDLAAATVLNRTVAIPRAVDIAVVLVTVVATAVLLVVRVRRGARPGAVAAAAVGSLVAGALGTGLAFGVWPVIAWMFPWMVTGTVGDPYRVGGLQAASTAAALIGLVIVLVVVRRRWSADDVGAGALVGATVLLAIAATGAGAGITFGGAILPAVIGAIAATAVRNRFARSVIAVVAGIPAAVLLVPFAVAMWDVGLEIGAVVVAIVIALVVACWYPLLDAVLTARRPLTSIAPLALLMVIVVVGAAVSVVTSRQSERQPVQEQLGYLMDMDSGNAWYVFADRPRSTWGTELHDRSAVSPDDGVFTAAGITPAAAAAASPLEVVGPEVEVLSDTRDGDRRTVRLRIGSPRSAQALALRFDADVAITDLTIDNRTATFEPTANVHGVTVRDGSTAEVEITVTGAIDTMAVHLSDVGADMTGLPDFEPPNDVVVSAPSVRVLRTVTLD